MPLIGGFNSRRTENNEAMKVGELAESLRGVEHPAFSDEDDPEGDYFFQKAFWRDSEVTLCLEDEDGNREGFYVITRVGYSCISPEPYVRIRKKTYPERDVAQHGMLSL